MAMAWDNFRAALGGGAEARAALLPTQLGLPSSLGLRVGGKATLGRGRSPCLTGGDAASLAGVAVQI